MTTRHQAQAPVRRCEHHPEEEYDSFCYTCKERICQKCCRGDHMTHDWERAKTVVGKLRKDPEKRCNEIVKMIHQLTRNKELLAMSADIERIEKLRVEFISLINEIAETLTAKRRGKKSSRNERELIKKLETFTDFFRNEIHSADDNVILEVEEDFYIQKEILSSYSRPGETKLRFEEGIFSPDVIHQMFGDVVEGISQSRVKVKQTSLFTHIDDSDHIYRVIPVAGDVALIQRSNGTKIDHVTIKGELIKELRIRTGYFIMMDNDIVSTDFGDKKIQRFSSSGTMSGVCSTAPLHPSGICRSHNDGMLVCLCDCKVSDITPDSKGEIIHIDKLGHVTDTYSHLDDKRSDPLINPNRVAQNINTDLCVVDIINREYECRLVVLSITGQIRFVYKGQPVLKEKFSSKDVCCDHRGRIIVTDLYNDVVHLLREDGHFLQFILTKHSPLCRPRCLGLHGDTLWVGCNKGVIRVYTYNDD